MPKSKVTSLRHVGVAAPNFDETVAFYTDAWGLKKVDGENGIAFFAAEGSPENYILRVRKADEKRVDLGRLAAENAAAVDDMAKELASAGVRFVSEPGDADRRPAVATASGSSTPTAAPSRYPAT